MRYRVIIPENYRAKRFSCWSRRSIIKRRTILAHHEVLFSIPAQHPVFAGHFPGHPIVPGVMLIDEVIHTVESTTGQAMTTGGHITMAKFYSPASPGEVLTLCFDTRADASIAFEIHANNRRIAAGDLSPAAKTSTC
ncbi:MULTISPECIES: 3-hydroxyacyl-ACP dehydratase FabZ family protein [Acidithiobacillus]|uniref:ApeI dehydratase-like domain-containing protein n=2 Tax=Acidithiobacillus ferrooxidans TaxID=920 RepID=A0A2W1K5U8_ACIFR|nr:hypothetical protein [Acidithiobacillus sp. MC2.2]MBN6746735.1 hypothetical protein [Acidithiobacillus sp. PG05]MBU2775213.1 hypothetical protein [Acidithiobacillus ferrooxidans]MBU2823848.1 hypothetical protein [Acidithiobacillus ferrooxidans]PZD82139.1 hypothetical protein DN052_03660 [Acidithiobacillus ferrooxidans]